MSSFLPGIQGLDRRIVLLAAARGVNTMGFSIVMPFLWGALSAGMTVLGIGYFMFARVYLVDESGSGIVRAK